MNLNTVAKPMLFGGATSQAQASTGAFVIWNFDHCDLFVIWNFIVSIRVLLISIVYPNKIAKTRHSFIFHGGVLKR